MAGQAEQGITAIEQRPFLWGKTPSDRQRLITVTIGCSD
jgi:hypothetical protein